MKSVSNKISGVIYRKLYTLDLPDKISKRNSDWFIEVREKVRIRIWKQITEKLFTVKNEIRSIFKNKN